MTMLLLIVLCVIVGVICGGMLWGLWGWWREGVRIRRMMTKWPGPPTLPMVGNAHQLGTTTAGK